MDRGRVVLLIVVQLVAVAVAPASATTETQADPVDQFQVLGVRADGSAEMLFAAKDHLLTRSLTADDLIVRVDGEAVPTRLQRLSPTDLDLAVVIDTTLPLEVLRSIQGAVVQLATELPASATMRIATADGEIAPPAAVPDRAIAQIRQLTPGTGDGLQRGVSRATAALDRSERDHTAVLVVGRDLGRRLRPIDDQPFGRLIYAVDITAAQSQAELLGSGVAGRVITVEDADAVLSATDEMSRDVRNLYHLTVGLPDRDAQNLTLRIPADDSTAPARTVVLAPGGVRPPEPAPDAPRAAAGGDDAADDRVATPSVEASSPDVTWRDAVAPTVVALALLVLSVLWQLVRRRRDRERPPHRGRRAAVPARPGPPPSHAQPARVAADPRPAHDVGDAASSTADNGTERPASTVDAGGGRLGWAGGGAGSVARPIAKPGPHTRRALTHALRALRHLALASRAVADRVPDDLFRLAEARANVALSRQDVGLEEVLAGALSDDEDVDVDLVRRSATALSVAWQHTARPSSAPSPVVEVDAVRSCLAPGRNGALQRHVVPVRALNPLVDIGLQHVLLANQPDRDSQLVARAVTAVDIMRAARLARPVLALSPFLLDDRARYQVSLETDLTDTEQCDRWLEFLCRCIARGASQSADRLTKLDRLRTRYCQRTTDARARPFIDLLLSQPIIDASLVADRLQVSEQTAGQLISSASATGWLCLFADRPDTWIADEVLSLFARTPDMRNRASQSA